MVTIDESTMAQIIKEYRNSHSMSQRQLAKAIGVSDATISVLENKNTNQVTPAIYNALVTAGLDLKEQIPNLIVTKLRGKDCNFHPDFDVPIKRKDPIKMLAQARDLVKNAQSIINSKISSMDLDIKDKESVIEKIKQLKKDLIAQKDKVFNEIIEQV